MLVLQSPWVVFLLAVWVTDVFAPNCGSSLVHNHGRVTSPNYPNDYGPDHDCVWNISSANGEGINFVFTDFYVETIPHCTFDHVVVQVDNRPPSQKYCGLAPPPAFTANSGTLKLIFKSDHTGYRKGFEATWSFFCRTGLTRFGSTCRDIDECATNNGGCTGRKGFCNNTIGSFSCTCVAGYTLVGTACRDIDECATNNGGCTGSKGICNNNQGSFSCTCVAGYTLVGTACQDNDECATNKGGCEGNCDNNPGSFTCSCEVGYLLAGSNCQDIDECQVNNADCQQRCTNTLGSYRCSCNKGWFQISRENCTGVSGCQGNGGCQQNCNELPRGARSCSCQEGFKLVNETLCEGPPGGIDLDQKGPGDSLSILPVHWKWLIPIAMLATAGCCILLCRRKRGHVGVDEVEEVGSISDTSSFVVSSSSSSCSCSSSSSDDDDDSDDGDDVGDDDANHDNS